MTSSLIVPLVVFLVEVMEPSGRLWGIDAFYPRQTDFMLSDATRKCVNEANTLNERGKRLDATADKYGGVFICVTVPEKTERSRLWLWEVTSFQQEYVAEHFRDGNGYSKLDSVIISSAYKNAAQECELLKADGYTANGVEDSDKLKLPLYCLRVLSDSGSIIPDD